MEFVSDLLILLSQPTRMYMPGISLKGMGVAMVTPFKDDKTIDYDSLERLIDHLVSGGADYLVVLGTTAETPALSPSEKESIKNFIREKNAGRISLILGCGGNNTEALCRELREDNFEGYDAILSVVPYYNKPSQEGIYRHYEAVAKASPLPVVLYNVPGRTGVNMTAETTLRIANDFPNVIGIKEASGKMTQIDDIISHKPERFELVSGDDGLTYPLLTMGAVGVISVIGNAFPREFGRLVRLCLEKDYDSARKIHYKFDELFRLLFVDGNPAGVKCLLSALGMIENELRLPLVPTRISTNERIHTLLESL